MRAKMLYIKSTPYCKRYDMVDSILFQAYPTFALFRRFFQKITSGNVGGWEQDRPQKHENGALQPKSCC
jgi:hypothetical protein